MEERPAPSCYVFFNDTATTEIYTLSLHDALPIYSFRFWGLVFGRQKSCCRVVRKRSQEHTSELQSPCNLVCRLLLEKKTQLIFFCDESIFPISAHLSTCFLISC